MTRVVIDGYIGAGKSTLIRNLEPLIKEWSGKTTYHSLEENLEEWENYYGENLLHNMYNGKNLKTKDCVWLTRFQTKAISDIARQEMQLQNKPGIYVQERDLLSVETVFMPLNKANFHHIDANLLNDLIQLFKEISPKKYRIFLYGDKQEMYRRMCKRGRAAESLISQSEYDSYCEAFDVLKRHANVNIDVTNISEEEVAAQVNNNIRDQVKK